MSFEELENLLKIVKACPSCGSDEGFWLAAQLYKRFLQCKHCGALIEICETIEKSENKQKIRRPIFRKK